MALIWGGVFLKRVTRGLIRIGVLASTMGLGPGLDSDCVSSGSSVSVA
jgi:hypothetical protein